MIELNDVYKAFGDFVVLNGMNLTVPNGQNYVLMGRSGIGKSVTLKHVIGILQPDAGSIRVDDIDVTTLDSKGLADLRKRMGYLFQNGALINWLTVFDNVALPLKEHQRLPKSELSDRVMRVLKLVHLDHAAQRYPANISGGMKLRAGLARALVTEPEYVLYDEPNAGLDPIVSDEIHKLIAQVRDEVGVTGLVVTHSTACALSTGDRIGVIDNGRIAHEGSVAEMQAHDDPLVREFLSGGAD